MSLGERVDGSSGEIFLNHFISVHIPKHTYFFSILELLEFDQFISEEDFDPSLMAFIKGNLIRIWELEELLIGRPYLELGISRCSLLQLGVPHEVFVVKSIEIRTFLTIGELGLIEEEVSVRVVPSVVVVTVHSLFRVKTVHKDFVFSPIVLKLL